MRRAHWRTSFQGRPHRVPREAEQLKLTLSQLWGQEPKIRLGPFRGHEGDPSRPLSLPLGVGWPSLAFLMDGIFTSSLFPQWIFIKTDALD